MIETIYDVLVLLGYIIGAIIFFTGVVTWLMIIGYVFIFQPVEKESPYSKENRAKFEAE